MAQAAKDMFHDRFAPGHDLPMANHPLGHRFHFGLITTAGDLPKLARRALLFEWTGATGLAIGVKSHLLAFIFHVMGPGELLAAGTAIAVLLLVIYTLGKILRPSLPWPLVVPCAGT